MAVANYEGPIVDTDVHNQFRGDSSLAQYLPPEWQSYVQANGRSTVPLMPARAFPGSLIGNGGKLADSYPADGFKPGSDYELLREQLLDRYGYFRCVLTHDVGEYPTQLNPYFAQALCRAVNDWSIDTWLNLGDERLTTVIVVPSATPVEAAAEVRRVADHPGMVGVLMAGNTLGRPLGDPLYHPIYEAAAECGLPIVVHPANTDRPSTHQIRAVGGTKATPIEFVPLTGQASMHYISSLIVHGVFEKYPTLKFLFNEYGISWLPSLIWRLDQNYDQLRVESPWVRRWPSEYIHDHVKLSTQPFEEAADDRTSLTRLLATIEGVEDMLCFSTDYPHISFDEPLYVSRLIPVEWHEKVFFRNSCDILGFSGAEEFLRLRRRAAQVVSTGVG
ncbi:amidohydrolase family protein [Pseudonocardia sp. GCM10023141]|uniref:amidohydrolase family protein n=1 Tax=Pseudonocardia sp. GCM10023141 TaxID=3252653 RepID=UPI00361E6641